MVYSSWCRLCGSTLGSFEISGNMEQIIDDVLKTKAQMLQSMFKELRDCSDLHATELSENELNIYRSRFGLEKITQNNIVKEEYIEENNEMDHLYQSESVNQRHPKRKHEEIDFEKFNEFKCHVCNENFNKAQFLTVHCRIVHLTNPQFSCFCGENFSSWNSLMTHKSKHIKDQNEISVSDGNTDDPLQPQNRFIHREENFQDDQASDESEFDSSNDSKSIAQSDGSCRKRKAYSVMYKANVLKDYSAGIKGKGLRALAIKHNVRLSTIRGWVKEKERIIFQNNRGGNSNCLRKKIGSGRKAKWPELESLLYDWYSELNQLNIQILPRHFKLKAKEIANELNLENFTASDKWLSSFKIRLRKVNCK
ncbi:CLUMA_CG020466, isoform A [Clunio marinus]|uniref:CLUMA_CG020466, isoform A n=1 Tax=Clunio marinus TaxID=568069 RepID=A0A1J1J6T5_9DIPT|nr:CLUMA_CG020466, isoform A [Clunio marinus]